MRLAFVFVLLFAISSRAGFEEPKAIERTEATQYTQEELEKSIQLSLHRIPRFEDYWDQYKEALPSYEIEYRGLRLFIYNQVVSAARKYALKQLRSNTEYIQNSWQYEAALRQGFEEPFKGFGRTKLKIGERYRIAKIWQLELYNDGRMRWDKDDDGVEGVFKGIGTELGFDAVGIKGPDIKVRMTVSVKLKLDKIENSEVGATLKFSLPWGVKLRLQGSAKGTGEAEASVQLVMWSG